MEGEKLTIRLSPRFFAASAKLVLIIGGLIFVYRFGVALQTNHVFHETEQLVDKGMPALAFEAIDSYRERFVSDERSCALILKTYSAIRRMDKLEWAVESCLHNGVRTFEVALARAETLMSTNQFSTAIDTLESAKAAQRWGVYPPLVSALMRDHREAEAVREIEGGLRAFPDIIPLKVIALRLYGDLHQDEKKLAIARQLKNKLLDGTVHDPALKILLANIFEKSGDAQSARELRQ